MASNPLRFIHSPLGGNPKKDNETMRNLILILLGLIITLDLSSQTNRRIVQFSGIVSEKYPIKMTLTIQNDKVLGFYYYEKYKSKILLSGQIQDTKITLNESPDYESEFKIGFIGDFKDKMFAGIWTDKTKAKTLNFKVIADTDKLMEITSQISRIEGTYENVVSSEKYISSIDLKYILDDLFCFEISNGTESGCVGYLKGLIKLTNLTNGIYSGDSCEEIKISVSSNELALTEKSCDLHGMRCPFEGKYKKK